MKFTKLSLIAAIAASSAFAGGDIAPVEPAPVVEAVSPWTFSGDAKLYYDTTSSDKAGSPDLFDQEASTGQAAVSFDLGYAINNNWKVNFGMTGLMTLGLEDSIVSNVWLGTDNVGNIGDALWVDTFNVTGTMFDGKLTTVLGRQELDTPLAFSEKWNIAPNTFDAAVAIAKPIEELSLVAAYIYNGNGNTVRGINTFAAPAGGFDPNGAYLPINDANGNLIENGAWTVAAIGTFSGVTAQAWYYEVIDIAQAVWLQADTEINGIELGAQYAWMSADDNIDPNGDIDDSSVFALKAGYKMDALHFWAAYSSVESAGDNKAAIPVANTATMLNGGGSNVAGMGWGSSFGSGQSKLYTEAWWNYGLVGQSGADTFAIAADYNVGDLSVFTGIDLMAQYTDVSGAEIWGDKTTVVDMSELTLLASANVADLNVQLAYIYSDYTGNDDVTGTQIDSMSTDTVQLYLTYKF